MTKIKTCDNPVVDSVLIKALKDFETFNSSFSKNQQQAIWVPALNHNNPSYSVAEFFPELDNPEEYVEIISITQLPQSKRTQRFLSDIYEDLIG